MSEECEHGWINPDPEVWICAQCVALTLKRKDDAYNKLASQYIALCKDRDALQQEVARLKQEKT